MQRMALRLQRRVVSTPPSTPLNGTQPGEHASKALPSFRHSSQQGVLLRHVIGTAGMFQYMTVYNVLWSWNFASASDCSTAEEASPCQEMFVSADLKEHQATTATYSAGICGCFGQVLLSYDVGD